MFISLSTCWTVQPAKCSWIWIRNHQEHYFGMRVAMVYSLNCHSYEKVPILKMYKSYINHNMHILTMGKLVSSLEIPEGMLTCWKTMVSRSEKDLQMVVFSTWKHVFSRGWRWVKYDHKCLRVIEYEWTWTIYMYKHYKWSNIDSE